MSTALTLTTVRDRRLAEAHADIVQAAIDRYRSQAKQMLKLARTAALAGNQPLSLGYLDLAETYRSMANGLADHQFNIQGE